MYILKLYILAGHSTSDVALNNIRRLCDTRLEGQYRLDVIDLATQPEIAEQERIYMTPVLVKVSPLPARRIIGDLSETKRVLQGLGLHDDGK